ncbi:Hsp70 family protein [Rhodococcoides fascians]|uniref:Hsp70 family protein n=1 Tax=Rhodococcoides fascians TaxID=1828 RepID=UPI00366B85CD
MSGWMLAVDFGTSNSAAAHTGVSTGVAETLPLTHQGNLMSSAVFVESPDSIDVGDVALNKAETNPAAFVPAPKRLIGSSIMHVNGYDIPPSLAVAAVLHTVLGRAIAAHRDQRPSRLVLTHPEGWSPREVGVLVEAAARIGFGHNQVTTVSEPRAAAHYYSRTETMAPGAKIAVFDFGGGTLDIAVLAATGQGTFEVIAARGDNGLGGKNLDALLRRWVDEQLGDRNPALLDFIRRAAPAHVHRTLDDSIRRAKELLSSTPSATITVSGNGQQETFTITRTEFDALISPTVEQAARLTGDTLRDAGIGSAGELSALYLTGGSSRIPLVHARLAQLGPIATLDDPKTVVAQGALIAAAAPQSTPPPAAGSQYAGTRRPEQPYLQQPPNEQQMQSPSWPAAQQLFAPNLVAENHPRSGSTDRRKRTVLIGGGAAVVIVIAVAAVLALTGVFSSTDDTTAAAEQAGTSAEATTAAAPTGTADSVEAIQAALPPALADVVTECVRQTYVMDVLQAKCTIDSDTPVIEYFGQYTENIAVSVDPKTAKRTLIGFQDYAMPNSVFTPNAAGTAGVNITTYDGYVSAIYTNRDTGIMVTLSNMRGSDAVLEFLRTTGLL